MGIHWQGAGDRVLGGSDAFAENDEDVTCSICKNLMKDKQEANPRPAAIYVYEDPAMTETDYMVTVWPDGKAELATREHGSGSSSWGHPTAMERREVT